MLYKFIDQYFLIFGFIFLFFMLSFPSVFQEVKYISLIGLLFMGAIEFIIKKKKMGIFFVFSILLWYSYYLISLLIGLFNGYPFSSVVVNIYFFTPIIAIILASIIHSNNRFFYLNKILILVTFVICIIDIIYLLNMIKIISLPFEINSEIFGAAKLSEEKVEFRITNQSSLIFLLPYVVAVYYSGGYSSIKEKYFLLVTIMLGVILAIFSGRRALELVVLLSFVLSFYLAHLKIGFYSLFKKGILNKVLKTIIIVLITVIFLFFNLFNSIDEFFTFLEAVYQTFIGAFDSDSGGSRIRIEQSIALINGWNESLLFGNGINSYAKDLIRDLDQPTSYEMVYIALLFQTGIIGFTLFFIFVLLILINLYKKSGKLKSIEEKYFFGIMLGFFCFILAGASNPLVYYLWAWSLALIGYQNLIIDKNVKN